MNTDERVDILNELKTKEQGRSNFEEDYSGLERMPSLFEAVEILLKHPGKAVYEITKGECYRLCFMLFVILCGCLCGYGLIMGSFSGGWQWAVVPVKTVGGILLSAVLCFPSLYIFSSLEGGKQSFIQAAGLMLMMLTLSSVLMVGFAPIAWLFSQSTHAVCFMGLFHVLFFCASVALGLKLLRRSMGFLNGGDARIVKLWGYMFILVVFQMCTVLRPMVDEHEMPEYGEKKLFLVHWLDTLDDDL